MKFYFAGGTLQQNAPSYVERQADAELLQSLLAGQFCYVLTSRQMGKSSLMVRTVGRLREANVTAAVLDLTAIGQNVTLEEWYGGLLMQLGERLDLEDELIEFWRKRQDTGSLQHWMSALREIVLQHIQGKIVLLIDEIDVTLSLPFRADEFFAGIRECYNRRAEDPELERLSFALFGVTSPTELIRDEHMTPFNIGHRIELHDFTWMEASPLAQGLSEKPSVATELLRRVIYWTNGHPYLTQRLCQLISANKTDRHRKEVDQICRDRFFSSHGEDSDDNLLFVREHLFRGGDLAGVLDLYRQVRSGRRVRDDETNPCVGTLLLSGIARSENGILRVRNRIYSRVFDAQWIEDYMPEAELRRQRRAYRRGLWKATAVAALVVALVSSFVVITFIQLQANRKAYYSQIRLVAEMWEAGRYDAIENGLKTIEPSKWWPDLRSFEWYILHHPRYPHFPPVDGRVVAVTRSPDGKRLAIADFAGHSVNKEYKEYHIRFYDFREKELDNKGTSEIEVPVKLLHESTAVSNATLVAIAFTSDAESVITADSNNAVLLQDLATRKTRRFKGCKGRILVLASSGSSLAAADETGTINIWNRDGFHHSVLLPENMREVSSLAISAGMLAAVDESGQIFLWDRTKMMPKQIPNTDPLSLAVFSPNGHYLLAAAKSGTLRIWDTHRLNCVLVLRAHLGLVRAAEFSDDGEKVATGGEDGTVKIWDLSGRELGVMQGHIAAVRSIAWTSNGNHLLTGGDDNMIRISNVHSDLVIQKESFVSILATSFSHDNKLKALGVTPNNRLGIWDVTDDKAFELKDDPKGHGTGGKAVDNTVLCAAFSPDGGYVATGGEKHEVKLWNARTGEPLPLHSESTEDDKGDIHAVVFSPDNNWLVSGSSNKKLDLWNIRTRDHVPLPESEADNWRATFSPDGSILAYAASGKRGIALWNMTNSTMKIIAQEKGDEDEIAVIAFSRDGKQLATAGENAAVKLWSVKTGHKVKSFGLARAVQRAAFSPDGKRLVTGNRYGIIQVWDLVAGEELVRLPGHYDEVTSITFAPDSMSLATSGADGRIRSWQAVVH